MKPQWMREIAKERIEILFNQAEKEFKNHPARSHRYVELARKLSMKYQVRISRKWRRRFCHKCYKFLVPGVNCRIRTRPKREKHLVIKCLECGNIMRIPLK